MAPKKYLRTYKQTDAQMDRTKNYMSPPSPRDINVGALEKKNYEQVN